MQSIIDGKVTNGTLFPNISFRIQADIEEKVEHTFRGLQSELDVILEDIERDIDMAKTRIPHRDNADVVENGDELRRREGMKVTILALKAEHSELLVSISNFV